MCLCSQVGHLRKMMLQGVSVCLLSPWAGPGQLLSWLLSQLRADPLSFWAGTSGCWAGCCSISSSRTGAWSPICAAASPSGVWCVLWNPFPIAAMHCPFSKLQKVNIRWPSLSCFCGGGKDTHSHKLCSKQICFLVVKCLALERFLIVRKVSSKQGI